MDTFRIVFSVLVCGLGALFGAAHLLRGRTGATDEIWARWDSPAGAERRRRRRRLGAVILILTSVAFAVGVNALSPEGSTVAFLGFWIVVLILVLWLCRLGLVDLVETRRVQLKMLAALRSQMPGPPGPSPERCATDSNEACE